jgi:WD40 repeat protein
LCTGFESFQEEREHGGEIQMMKASTDGRRFISVSPDKIQVWDTGNSKSLAEIRRDNHTIKDAALSPDVVRVVSISTSGDSYVRNAETGVCLHAILETIRTACFSPDGIRVAVLLSTVDDIQIWDSSKEDFENSNFQLSSQAGSAQACISFSPSGNGLAASVDDRIQIWEVKRWRRGGFELKEGNHDPIPLERFASLRIGGSLWYRATKALRSGSSRTANACRR